MHRFNCLSFALIGSTVIWLVGTIVHPSQENDIRKISPGGNPIMGLLEYADASEAAGTPVRFALYSDRTVIFRDRKNHHPGFFSGTVDEEAWQTFEKIINGLPEVKTNFAFSEDEGKASSLILFNDGKRMRQLAIYGPVLARKTGAGKAASYSTEVPPIQRSNSLWGGEIPQSAIGAWYETHFFVPKDAHPWLPDHFDVTLCEGASKKTATWPKSWPQLDSAKELNGRFTLQLPGKYLNEFETLFNKDYMETRISGRKLVVTHSIPFPREHELLSAVPLGVREESMKRQLPLPQDFLQKTNLSDVKKIARERGYDMDRIVEQSPVSDGIALVRSADVIEELCHSKAAQEVDAGLELALEAKRNPLRLASVIASTHEPEFTRTLIERHITDGKFLEVITPLIQESVARGADYDVVEPISTFWQQLKKQNNPLAWLPLHRTDIEQSFSFPSYRAGGSVSSVPSSSVQGTLEKDRHDTNIKPFAAAPVTFNEDAAARCVRSWKQHSNGKFEGKLFEANSVISASDISAKQLLKLQLDCLADTTPHEVRVEPVSAERILALMFGAASNGGAYPPGEAGAYGRLAAWQSLSALVGVNADGTFDEVYKNAKQCNWYSISSTSKWFHNITWDFGIVCLRSDKKHIAICAASDED